MRRWSLWYLAGGVRREHVTDDLPGPAFGNVPRGCEADLGGADEFLVIFRSLPRTDP